MGRTSSRGGKDRLAVQAADEIVSPELVLVSPPELAAEAREALPDFEREWEQLVTRLRADQAADEAAAAQRERRLARGGVVFTLLGALVSVAPLVLLIVFR
jgi:hypothetical protein